MIIRCPKCERKIPSEKLIFCEKVNSYLCPSCFEETNIRCPNCGKQERQEKYEFDNKDNLYICLFCFQKYEVVNGNVKYNKQLDMFN